MTPQTLRQYFENLANYNVDINDFRYGGTDRIITAQRSEINYPCLWMEIPEVRIHQDANGNNREYYTFGLTLFSNAPVGDFDEQNTITDAMYAVFVQVIARLITDANNGIIQLPSTDNDFNLLPVVSSFIDNDWGWRVELTIAAPRCIMYNQASWTS